MLSSAPGPIGVFDSGYGGLTILQDIRQLLPEYDYVYLGDNARSPYGNRSFEVVLEYTRQAVVELFQQGCHLVILACNTASAKALRSIQTVLLPEIDPTRRVLGIIRPTAEIIGDITKTRHVGLLATEGTVRSGSYEMEIGKLSPDIKVSAQACPLWAAIVEAGEAESEGASFFVKKRIDQLLEKDPSIDTILLGCTHYPLLLQQIHRHVKQNITILSQGKIVAKALKDYLCRHNEIATVCTKNGLCRYLTTENADRFKEYVRIFLSEDIKAEHISID